METAVQKGNLPASASYCGRIVLLLFIFFPVCRSVPLRLSISCSLRFFTLRNTFFVVFWKNDVHTRYASLYLHFLFANTERPKTHTHTRACKYTFKRVLEWWKDVVFCVRTIFSRSFFTRFLRPLSFALSLFFSHLSRFGSHIYLLILYALASGRVGKQWDFFGVRSF